MRLLRHRRRRPAAIRAQRAGFTLIEVVVALLIMTGVLLALGGFTAKFAAASSQTHLVVNANEMAAKRLDAIRQQPTYAALDTLAGTDSVSPYTKADGLSYVVKTSIKRTGSATDTVDYKTITVTVTQRVMRKIVSKTTVMAAF